MPVYSQRLYEGEEEAPWRRVIFAERKDQGRLIPLSRLLFSVDNLSWSLYSRELCSRALRQDPSLRPPLGHVGGA